MTLFAGLHYTVLQNMDGLFFIRIGTSQVVMDVDAFSTKPGTQVICYIQKDPPADNQLWMKGDVEADNNGFYLVSKLDLSCKITIQVTISPVHFTQTCLDNLQ